MRYQTLLFIASLFLMVLLFGQNRSMSYPPRSVHQWRQSDAYSMTLNYYHDGFHFFSPALHTQVSNEGRAVGEFPIIYYVSALLWKITGPSALVVRLLNLLIAFCGLFALFKLSYEFLKNRFLAAIIPLIIYGSPLFGYYSNSFLVNIDALSFLFVGWWFLYRFFSEDRMLHLIMAICFISLAGLLRTTMLIGYIPVALWFFIQFIGLARKDLVQGLLRTAVLGIPFVAVVVWMLYISSYNAANGSVYFLTTIRPIWETTDPGRIWELLVERQLSELYPLSFLIFLLLVVIGSSATRKKHNGLLNGFVLFLFVELVIYVLLWFANFDVHDYYLIELLILVPPVLILLFSFIKDHVSAFHTIFFKSVFALIVLILVLFGATKTRIKYEPKQYFLTELMLSDKEKELYQWFHWDYGMKMQAFETVEPYLEKIGIDRSKKVISIPDQSSNISLSLMDRKGYTMLYVDPAELKGTVERFRDKGAGYLMFFDSTYAEKQQLEPFMKHPVGKYRNIRIYKL